MNTITVLLNDISGFLQEEKAERALAALQKRSAATAKVIRVRVLLHDPPRPEGTWPRSQHVLLHPSDAWATWRRLSLQA